MKAKKAQDLVNSSSSINKSRDHLSTPHFKKNSQLDDAIEQMFQEESDMVINDAEEKGYGKFIIILIAIMMTLVILLSFIYKIL